MHCPHNRWTDLCLDALHLFQVLKKRPRVLTMTTPPLATNPIRTRMMPSITLHTLLAATIGLLFLSSQKTADAFVIRPVKSASCCHQQQPMQSVLGSVLAHQRSVLLHSTPTDGDDEDGDAKEDSWDIGEAEGQVEEETEEEESEEEIDENDFEILFKEEVIKESNVNIDGKEKAWRHAKKPLLSIGAKGATFAHGNSLRQLLEAHTAVKVKVNTRRFGSIQAAFDQIVELAEEAGAPKGIELIQSREKDSVILFALPGTLAEIEKGHFPPVIVEPVRPDFDPREEKQSEE